MSNAVATLQTGQFTPDQMTLIMTVVAKGATQDELKLFLYRCQNMGLDPLKPGQVHFIKYGNSPGTIVVGIDGFRSIASRTGKMAGVRRGVTKDDKGVLLSAWAEVFRSDWQHPAREEVPFSEYNTGKGPWAKMPETMLKKVAEAAALRMAFPDHLGGVYTREEMDQAESERGRITPGTPGPDDGDQTERVYKIPNGGSEWRGRTLEECYRLHGPQKMMERYEFIAGLPNRTDRWKRAHTQDDLTFLENCAEFLGSKENAFDPNEPTHPDNGSTGRR